MPERECSNFVNTMQRVCSFTEEDISNWLARDFMYWFYVCFNKFFGDAHLKRTDLELEAGTTPTQHTDYCYKDYTLLHPTDDDVDLPPLVVPVRMLVN